MMNVIKTAIATIVLSIISGLLLEYFKGVAPRILCNIKKGKSTEIDNKRVYSYIITVSNLSKKIVHELSVNVQGSNGSLTTKNAKITKGLKFESSIKNNGLDAHIPFLSKGDKFTAIVYVENPIEPVVVVRSPENFKRVDSMEEMGLLALFTKSSKSDKEISHKNQLPHSSNDSDSTIMMDKPLADEIAASKRSRRSTTKQKGITKNKRIAIAIVSVVVLLIALIVVKVALKTTPASSKTSTTKTDTTKQSTTDATKDESEKSKDTKAKTSTGGSTNSNIKQKKSIGGESNNTDKNNTTGTSGNTDQSSQPKGQTTDTNNTDNQPEQKQKTDTNSQSGGSGGNTDVKPQNGDQSGGTNTNSQTTGGTSQSPSTNTPSTSTSGSNTGK